MQQIFDALRARSIREKLVPVDSSNTDPAKGLAVGFVRQREGEDQVTPAFTLELFRVDKSPDFQATVDSAIPLDRLPEGMGLDNTLNDPNHVVVANIGLHFSDSHTNETQLFVDQLRYIAKRLKDFNQIPGNSNILK